MYQLDSPAIIHARMVCIYMDTIILKMTAIHVSAGH